MIVGVYFLVLHQLEANVLVPKIMERRVGVSPVTVIIALLIGGRVVGLRRRDSRHPHRGDPVGHRSRS